MSNLVAVDSGYGQVKGYNGTDSRVIFDSLVGELSISTIMDLSLTSRSDGVFIKYNSNYYVVGRKAVLSSYDVDYNLVNVKVNDDKEIVKILVAIYLLEGHYSDIILVLGLPVMEYLVQRNSLKEVMQNGFEYQVYSNSKWEKCITQISRVIVMPQSCGAFYDYILDTNSKVIDSDLQNKVVGVVDIGFRTSDLVMFNEGFEYNSLKSITVEWAMLDVYRDLQSRLVKSSIHINLPLYLLPNVVKTGKVRNIDCSLEVSNSLDILYSKYKSTVISLWKDLRMLDKILITSGGGLALRNKITGSKYIYSEDMEMANVRGFYKYGRLIGDL